MGSSGQDPDRFAGIRRDYTPEDVARLSGSFRVRHTLAEMGAARLWHLLKTEPYVNTLGALTGNQAMQQVKAGLKASLITHGLGVIAALALSDVLLSLRPFVRLCEPLVLTRRRFRMRQRLRTASSVRGLLIVLPPLLVRHHATAGSQV